MPFTAHFPFEPEAVPRMALEDVSAEQRSFGTHHAATPVANQGLDYCRIPRTAQGPGLLYCTPVYSTAVLRDSQL